MRAAAALVLALVLPLALIAGTARADGGADEKTRAKEAYTRGLKAHDAKDYPAAARAFAEADTILPSAVALGAALDAAVDADDPILGAELLDRSTRPGATPALNNSIATARKKLGGRAGKVRLTCPTGSLCRVVINGRETTSELWVAPGKHVAAVTVDGAVREQPIDVRAGETLALSPEKPSASPPAVAPAVLPTPTPTPTPPPTEPTVTIAATPETPASHPPLVTRGVPPIVVYIGGGATLIIAGTAVVAGVMAQSKHSEFTDNGCNRGPATGCKDLQESGQYLVLGTNILIATAAVTGALTALVGIAFTDWHPTAAVLPGGGYAGLGRSF